MNKFRYTKVFLVIELLVLCLTGVFYFSCGETLYVRESDGNVAEFAATNDTGEILKGGCVEQTYTSQMDKVKAIGVMASNYGQSFDSQMTIRCEDQTDGHLIAEQTYDVADIGVNQYTYLPIPDNSDIVRGHVVKITVTSNATSGNAPTVLYNVGYVFEKDNVGVNAALTINGTVTPGTLCFSVQGSNYVWTGPNYWKLVLLAMTLFAIWYFVEVIRDRKQKFTILFGTMQVLKKYKFLIKQLVKRDFKVRYKRSVLGVFWSFLNPLLMMSVQYVVFSQLFKSDIDNYPVYLLSGLVIFNFFNEGVGQALSSIVGNASLITKVYIPKYIYPVTRVLSSGINLVMSLIPLFIAALLTGETVTKAYLMLPYLLLCVLVFTIGFGMILAAAMTFFRDVQFLWGVLSMLWMYLTPLFYPISIIPEGFRPVIVNNPMYYFVSAARSIVLEGITPRPMVFCQCTIAAVIMLVVGCFIFKKTQDKFVFYI